MIAALAAHGTQPDVVCIMGKVLLPLAPPEGVMPLNDAVFKTMGIDTTTQFVGDAIGAYTYQNEIWGVPVESNQVGQVVNVPVDDVKAAGLDKQYPPTNGKLYFESYEDMWRLPRRYRRRRATRSRAGVSAAKAGICRAISGSSARWARNGGITTTRSSVSTVRRVSQAMQLFAETPVKMGIETELDQNSC